MADNDSNPNPQAMVLSAGNLRGLADRLEARATSMLSDQPYGAGDLRTAARFIRHALRVGWVVTSISIA